MSDLLAETLFSDEPTTIDVKLYYIFTKTPSGQVRIKVLEDEEGKKKLEEQDPESVSEHEKVQVLNTKWRVATWLEQNNIISETQSVDPMTQQVQADYTKYRDLRMKKLLYDWDLMYGDQKVPVTEEHIDRLPAEIGLALYDKFESAVSFDEEDQGKS